ncbi:MAG: hypothetical protein AABZ47_08600 [Planctomycetota bacterium]
MPTRIEYSSLLFFVTAGWICGFAGFAIGEEMVSPRNTPEEASKLIDVSFSESDLALSLRDLGEILTSGERGPSALHLSVESSGKNTLLVSAGGQVEYDIIGTLGDDYNEGLALFGFDLAFDGGDLAQAYTPTGLPSDTCDDPANFPRSCCEGLMIHFVKPWGINNPAGFGGTPFDGMLLQVGGAQNTIGNQPEINPFPIGPVNVGVAKPLKCGETVLVTGRLTAPYAVGVYKLSLHNAFANIIRAGETGRSGFWRTQAAEIGTIENLTIIVTDRFRIDRSRKGLAPGEDRVVPGGRFGQG